MRQTLLHAMAALQAGALQAIGQGGIERQQYLGLPREAGQRRAQRASRHIGPDARRGGRGRLCMGLGGRQRGAGQCRHDQRDAGFHAQDARMEGSGRQGHIVGFQAKKIEASPVCQSKTQK